MKVIEYNKLNELAARIKEIAEDYQLEEEQVKTLFILGLPFTEKEINE